MTLKATSLDWAIDFVLGHSDGDLFPRVLEMEGVAAAREDFKKQVIGKDLAAFSPGSCRRFIVPKDEYSYRQATQLDPQDSILISALIYQYGGGIEKRRLAKTKVFSYRFKPTDDDGLYGSKTSWNDFWKAAEKKAQSAPVSSIAISRTSTIRFIIIQ